MEETVLAAQKTLELSDVGKRLPFCAFNGKFQYEKERKKERKIKKLSTHVLRLTIFILYFLTRVHFLLPLLRLHQLLVGEDWRRRDRCDTCKIVLTVFSSPSCFSSSFFTGGNDVFVDIGDKKLGVACCQRFFGDIQGLNTLHVGDQFLSISGNDFRVRFLFISLSLSLFFHLS